MVFYLLGTAATKDRLRAVIGMLDPLVLLDEIRAVQHHLAALAAGATVHPMPERDADLDGFLRSLALAWRAGEVRPTHRARTRPPQPWRTRQDPFEMTWPRIIGWLEAEPHRTAKELFDRLRREQPRGRSSQANFELCSAASATGGAWPAVVSSPPIRRHQPRTPSGRRS